MKHHENVPDEIRALQRVIARGARAAANEDFARLEEILAAGECLQPYELELVRGDALPLDRWEHVRACVTCQLMLDGARLPEEKEAAPIPIPAELLAAVQAGTDGVLSSVPQTRAERRGALPALACAVVLLLVAGVGYVALGRAPLGGPAVARSAEVATPTAAEMFVRLKRVEPAGAAMEWAAPGLDGAAYLRLARRLKDQGSLGDAALVLCIAEGLSRNDPGLAEQVHVVVSELDEAADLSGR